MTPTQPSKAPGQAPGRRPRRLRLIPPGDPRRDEPKPIGVADSGPARPVVLPVPGARHHMHVVGHTGGGKSTELLNLILADARAGRGVAVFDPKGDLVNDVLPRLPSACGSRLVVIDPAEMQAPPSLNILDAAGRDDELVIENVTGVLRRLYADTWGPRIDDTLRSAIRTLIDHPGVTLADVPVLLTNRSFRQRLTARFRRDDPEGLGAFWDAYEALTPAGTAQACGPLLSKLRPILGRRFVADLLGSATSSFAMADILDGGILLARLPKGVLGDDACRLVGSLLLAQLWQTALTRASLPEDDRPDAAAYIDEVHNFLHLPIGLDDALGEARGYHLSLVLAHQHLAQLPKEMGEALHANARNKLFFTVSPDDAKRLAGHVGPYLAAEDLAWLDRFQAASRLVIDQRNTPGFTMATRPAPPAVPGRAEELRAAARVHGLPRADRDRQAKRRRFRAQAVSDSLSSSVSASLSGSLSDLETDSEPDTRPILNSQVTAESDPTDRFPTGLYRPFGRS